ncbi:MAG: hypothetical protein ACI4JY_11160 [Oscillospiraceae bacterium]
MNKVAKGFMIAGVVLASLVALIILWEIFCIVVNYTCAIFKTMDIMNGFSNTHDIEVLDNVTFVGNTSGTGNHTEARSTVLVNATGEETIEYWLGSDSENSRIYPLFEKVPEEKYERWDRELELPYDNSKCYVVEVYSSVPFRDSIIGH